MYYGDEAIALNKIGGSKSLRLLQILLLSRRSGISKNELMDYLYGWNEKAAAVNRNKNLNNLIYRLKGQLISCGLPDSEYIKIREGMCWFKPEFPVVLDTEVFEETVETVKKMRGGRTVCISSKGRGNIQRRTASHQSVGNLVFSEKQAF